MTFNKIVIVDQAGLDERALQELNKFSKKGVIKYENTPGTEEEIVKRISDAECILVSWNTQITKAILNQCPNLKYVGMCCSLYDERSANVDIAFARQNNIVVKGVRDYGDEGVVEYIMSELIQLIKGIGKRQWKKEPVELTNRKLGIIGLGTTGRMLADRAKAFNMDVHYYSRNRKEEVERDGIKYLPIDQLLGQMEMISIHLPKNTTILGEQEFRHLGEGKILINTSLGLTFERSAFLKWVQTPENYAILDGDGIGPFSQEFSSCERIISTNVVSGWTKEAKERLSRKVVDNIRSYAANIFMPPASTGW